MIPDFISKRKDIPWSAKGVYGYLVRCEGKTGSAFPSKQNIADAVGLSVRQVQYCLHFLEKYGILKITKRMNALGQSSNLYEFVWREWMGEGEAACSPSERDTAPIKEQSEENSLPEEHDLEPLATNASHSQPAVSADVLSTALFSVKSGGQLNTSPPTTGITQYARKACIAAAERHLSDAAIAAMISTIPHIPGASYAYYITSAANAYADQRNGYYNWRPEHTTASPEFEHGTHMAEVLDDEPVGAVQ